VGLYSQHIAPVCQFTSGDGQWVVIGCQQLAQHAQVAGQVSVVCLLHKLLVGVALGSTCSKLLPNLGCCQTEATPAAVAAACCAACSRQLALLLELT